MAKENERPEPDRLELRLIVEPSPALLRALERDAPRGCVCPPGAEATCRGFACPRGAGGNATRV
jgi:hypothetical protein